MNIVLPRKNQLALAAVAALATLGSTAPTVAGAGEKKAGHYVTGDFHNHTTCSDGSISMQKLVKKSTDKQDTPWGLDWFVQAGHGGSGNRNCTLAEDATLATPAYPLVSRRDGTTSRARHHAGRTRNPARSAPKGRVGAAAPTRACGAGSRSRNSSTRSSSIWRALQEHAAVHGPRVGRRRATSTPRCRSSPARCRPPSTSSKLPTSPGYTPLGNATALAQWSYCFDRGDTDTSRGNTTVGSSVGNNWNCSVAGSANAADPSWNAAAQKLMPAGGAGTGERGHAKTVEAMKWMAQYHPRRQLLRARASRARRAVQPERQQRLQHRAPAQLQQRRADGGVRLGDAAGPRRFGCARRIHRPPQQLRRRATSTRVGGTTWGGTGVYGAQIGGVWDALLGEGRNWWFFASSDWHNRGMFGPDDRRSTQDFYPGEYQRDYVMVRDSDGRMHDGTTKQQGR